MRPLLFLLATLSMLFAAPAARAQLLIPDSPADAQPLRVNSQEVKVAVHDRIAVTSIEQEFYNPSSRTVTGTYLFPMPREATVTSFTYWVRGREVKARLLARDEAEKRFSKAAGSGKGAALLQDVDKISFQCRISPVLPDTVTRVRIEYLQALPYARNEVTVLVPLKVLDRAAQVASLKVDVQVDDQLPIERYSSPTHPGEVRFKAGGPNAFSATFTQGSGELPPILKLSYRLKPTGMGATLLTYREKGKPGYFLLQLAPTSTDTRDVQVPRDIAFVFDRSGSMAGEKIEQAKRALRLGLEGLRPGDRFSLISYNAEIQRFREGMTPVSDAELQAARQWVDALQPMSGTNIHDALLAGLAQFAPSDTQRLIVFLTDGLPTVGITNKDQIVKSVSAANTHRVRIFSWAFGKDADDLLLARISGQNFATAEHYSADEVIEAKLRAFYQRAGQPILLDTKLDYGTAVKDVIPDRLPDLYHGVSLMIVGRYDERSKDAISVTGTRGKELKTETLAGRLPDQDTRHPFLAQLWARSKAASLVRSIHTDGEQQSTVEEIVRLSKQYSILTPYTTFFADAPKDRNPALAQGAGDVPAPALVGQTRFAVAGDPRMVVTAPAGTRSVIALFPWGDRADLTRIAGTDRWFVRFIVPAGTPDGSYEVRLALIGERGRVSWKSVQFSAAVKAPAGTVETSRERVPGGWKIGVNVRVGAGVAQAFVVLEGTGAVQLRRVAGREYYGELFVPQSAARTGAVRVVLLDAAHNRKVIALPSPSGK
ncbi:MAG: von Willebrand factor type domain protein [Armatimonadetes bacterium]|nr:von Willebrand factor type domain protein [Armatimonadota bacterium]